jgi:hypothetical protein
VTGATTMTAVQSIEMSKGAADATTRYCMRDRAMPAAIL